jgi:hypothetical protein
MSRGPRLKHEPAEMAQDLARQIRVLGHFATLAFGPDRNSRLVRRPTGRPAVSRVPVGTQGPGHDPAVRRAVADFVYAKGNALRPRYALLCVVYWLQHEHGCAAVATTDVKALLPHLGGSVAGRVRSPTDTLRRFRDEGLVEALGDGVYWMTTRGAAVVRVLPDDTWVSALRAAQRTSCRRRPPGEFAGPADGRRA